MNRNIFTPIIILLVLTNISFAQFNEYEPEFEWLSIETEHVFVHYHSEAERTARVVAKIAEEVWGPLTSLYHYEPDKVHFVIKDIDDYSNGATYFFDNKIEIWASALDFDLRGSHNWLRNVISHEFTHMVQIQASMKMGRSVPAIYLQLLNYEDVRRQDILYGYPNVIVSYPLATINVPAWFAEGTAQYMRKDFNYDNWDTHRDMILRSYVLDGNMLSWNQMGVFGKTSLGNESVYNSGFALTRYISEKYGEGKLREIAQKLGSITNFTIDAAFEDVLGKDGNEIYDEWANYLKADYTRRMSEVINNSVEGKIIGKEGFGNFYPVFTENGSKLLYISNKDADYFQTSIFEYDFNTKKEKQIKSSVRSTVNFIPGKNKIIYAKLSEKNPKWRNIHDLYVYDLDEEEETRITHGLRANNPDVSHDGKKIVFLFQRDGTTNLGSVDIDGSNFKRITFFENGEQVFNPKFSPDDSYVVFGFIKRDNRSIAKVNSDGTNFELVIDTPADERNPAFGQDGKFYFSSDETNIYNIYSYDFADGKKTQLTNVKGGAFYPAVRKNGDIAYAGYTSKGYKLFFIDRNKQNEVKPGKNYVWQNDPPLGKDNPNGDINNFDLAHLRNYDDTKTPDYEEKDYSGKFTKLTFFPFIRYDNYNPQNSGFDKIKPGVYVSSTDMLNRYSIFASVAFNRKLERDLFLIFNYRNKIPGLYQLGLTPELSLELYSVSRKTNVDVFFGVDSTSGEPIYDDVINTDVTYDLFEVDFAAKHKIFATGNEIEFRFIFSRYISKLGSFIIPDGNNSLFPSRKDEYFIGRNIQIKFNHDNIALDRDKEINPIGRRIELKYNYEFNKFNPEGEFVVEDGILKPVFNKYNFSRVELNWKEYISIADGHTLEAHLRAASILGPPVPDFFDYYLGGLIGMKAYPFYSASGNELGWMNLTYRFPLFRDIDARLGSFYLDKIFLSIYGDLGNAWTGNFPGLSKFKKGAGAEIRMKMISFYLFPTAIFFNASYGFDTFERQVRGQSVHYGKEWRLYGGILFDFSL